MLALALAGGLGGACAAATAPTIDGTKIETKILDESAATDIHVTAVDCPSGREAKANESFPCKATVDGGAGVTYDLTYDVLISSDKGDYTYKLAPNQTIDGEVVAAEVTADVTTSAPDFASATVSCPSRIVAPTGAATFECALVLGEHRATLTVSKQPGQVPDWGFKK